MSNEAREWVWDRSTAHGVDRMVLLVLADEADACGLRCFPSLRRIADRAAVDVKTARAAVARLEAAGEVAVLRPSRRGRGNVNRYAVLMGRDAADLIPDLDPLWVRVDNRLPLGITPGDNTATEAGDNRRKGGRGDPKRGTMAGTNPGLKSRPFIQSPLVAVVEPTVAAAAVRRERDMARQHPSCAVCGDDGRIVDETNTVAACPACRGATAV